MRTAFTGHRPDKLSEYSDCENINGTLAMFAIDVIERLDLKPSAIISGMALGWDIAVARAALRLEIPLIAAVPFKGQESKWPWKAQVQYHAILKFASEVVIVSEGGYEAWKMKRRNRWIVDNSERLVALWDGSDGGTAHCVEYANQVGRKQVVNVWGAWELWLTKSKTARVE